MANGIGCLNKNEEQRMNEITYDDYSTRCPNKKKFLSFLFKNILSKERKTYDKWFRVYQ